MFTLPPRPPKDYFLQDVSNTQASAPELTPSAIPRATQTTLGKYCYPIPADDNEPADKSQIVELNDQILDKITKDDKAWWIDKPGLNAYFITDIYNKYSVVVDPDYDPRYKHRPKVFQRSYKYELDCVEEARLQKLRAKMKREEDREERKQQKIRQRQKAMEKPDIEIVPCKLQPPSWWKESSGAEHVSEKMIKTDTDTEMEKTTYEVPYPRWQMKPQLFEDTQTDPCKRRAALAKFRLPFMHEACTWYFKNYPPPNIKFIPGRVAK